MDFTYSEFQESTRKLVHEWVENEVRPEEYHRFTSGVWDSALFRRLGELGISQMLFSEEWGGVNADYLTWCLVLETVARGDPEMAGCLMVTMANARQVVETATEEQKAAFKDKYLTPVINAECMCSGAITEPEAGTDVSRIQTKANLVDDKWIINGEKTYITNSGLENNVFISVLCVTDNKGSKEFNYIFVPTDTPGITINPMRTMYGSSHELGQIFFNDCCVPAFNLLGQRGKGQKYVVRDVFATARIGVASLALGVADACFEDALSYAKNRIAFGRPISKHQYIKFSLAEMALTNELSRMMRDKAAMSVVGGTYNMKLSSMSKFFCCESANQVAYKAIQIHGGLGLMDEVRVSRFYRFVRGMTIADGTSEIQRHIIARELDI